VKKFLFFLFVLFFAFNVKAQMWCPPGATWHYNKIIFGGNGYTRVTYAGTVTVNAKVCQQLNGFTEYYDPTSIPSQVTSFTLIPYYTHFSNNVVFLKDAWSNAFDTLYDFNAIPGSKWLLPERYSNMFFNFQCNKSRLTVLDTGHKTIQNINLKWLKVQITLDNSSQNDTIYERFGFLNNYFLQYDNCTGLDYYVEGGSLRCYSDAQIFNYKKVIVACNDISNPNSLNENSLSSSLLKIYPNPSNGNFTVELDKPCKVSIYNTLGDLVYDHEFSKAGNFQVNLSDLAKGIYTIKAENEQGISYYKIIKN
jgi:hypothetical protein